MIAAMENAIAVDAAGAWLSDAGAGAVVQVLARHVVRRIAVAPFTGPIARSDDAVWVATADALKRRNLGPHRSATRHRHRHGRPRLSRHERDRPRRRHGLGDRQRRHGHDRARRLAFPRRGEHHAASMSRPRGVRTVRSRSVGRLGQDRPVPSLRVRAVCAPYHTYSRLVCATSHSGCGGPHVGGPTTHTGHEQASPIAAG